MNGTTERTWQPVLVLAGGEIVRLPGGLSHSEAMKKAEKVAMQIPEVVKIAAHLEVEECFSPKTIH